MSTENDLIHLVAIIAGLISILAEENIALGTFFILMVGMMYYLQSRKEARLEPKL